MRTLHATASDVVAPLDAARPRHSRPLFFASWSPVATRGWLAGAVAAAESAGVVDWDRSAALSGGTSATGSGRREGEAGASWSRMVAVGDDEAKIINDVVSARFPCETRLPASHRPAIASAAILPPPSPFPSALHVGFDPWTCLPCVYGPLVGQISDILVFWVSEPALLTTATSLLCSPERPCRPLVPPFIMFGNMYRFLSQLLYP